MKYRKFILHTLILFVLLCSITAISAADLNDTDNFDVLKDDNQDGSFMNLEGDMSLQGSTFNLEQNYKFDNTSDLLYVDGINITKNNYVINGNNHVIDCNNQARAFTITGSNVMVNNLIIKNGFHDLGSAIKSTSSLTLKNVTFINCSGNGTENVGAVFSSEALLTVMNSNFIDNAGEEGASISGYGSIVIVGNSTFISSSDKIIKGQIYLYQSDATIDKCNFLNTTSRYAAAIFAEKELELKITNSRFKNLHANKTAGAIAIKLIKSLNVENCEFDNATSANNGGAIFADANGNIVKNNPMTVWIDESRFTDCYSGFGGAILQLGGGLTVLNSNFTSNVAEYEGGALYTSYAIVQITNSKFDSNTLLDNISYGGAAYFDMGRIRIVESDFTNNLGHDVSTLFSYDSNVTLIDNYFNNPSNVTSIYAVYGKVLSSGNNFTNDKHSTNNTNYNYNFENVANPFIILNNSLSFDELPDKFDLRTYGWVSPVKDQGFMGACWAFGNMAALESALMRYANVTYSLSVNNVQNTMLKYSKYGTKSFVEGANNFHGLEYMIDWLGIYPEEYDGYDELGKISSLFITPEDIHIQNVIVIPAIEKMEDNDLLKEALIKYGVLSVSHRADFNESKYYNPVYSAQFYNGKEASSHMVALVGWDDNFSAGNFNPLNRPPGDGAWIVKNSWGTDWGDNGYFYVSYYDKSFADDVSIAYLINNDSYNRIYQLDVGGDKGYYKDSKYYLNEFTAEKDELIAAVGTYFDNPGQSYELAIGVNGIAVYTKTGVSSFGGYETIKLDKYVQIKKGDVFRVVFQNKAPLILNSRIHLLPDKSLVSTDVNGDTWIDLAGVNAVAIAKAYTITDINITNPLVKYYGNDTPFIAKVGPGETVIFEFDDENYTVIADENGIAKLPIDKDTGNYNITTTYNNISIVNYIKINSTIISSDVTRGYNSNYNYKIQIVTSAGKPLSNTKVPISINGKMKNYTTDGSGYVTLKFTKLTKQQTIIAVNPSNADNKKTKITVKSRFSGAKNVAMYYFDGSKFKARIVGDDGKFVGKNQAVSIKLNKKTYKVKTDKNGYITLKIPNTVKPGKYTLKATYKGQTISKTVKVKQNLKTSKYTVKKTAKKLKVKATLKNGKTAVKGKKITLKVNGKKFKATTNKKGIAQFTINKNVIKKLKAGKTYTMKVTYLKNTIKTTLKVKR